MKQRGCFESIQPLTGHFDSAALNNMKVTASHSYSFYVLRFSTKIDS